MRFCTGSLPNNAPIKPIYGAYYCRIMVRANPGSRSWGLHSSLPLGNEMLPLEVFCAS